MTFCFLCFQFVQQKQHFDSTLALYLLDPGRNNHDLESVLMFLASVASCYKEEMADFSDRIMDVLKDHQAAVHPDMRLAFCRALILLRNKGLAVAVKVMETFFLLMRIQDKKLRAYLESFIISDIKNVNSKHRSAKVNGVSLRLWPEPGIAAAA
jgi:protein SDA1